MQRHTQIAFLSVAVFVIFLSLPASGDYTLTFEQDLSGYKGNFAVSIDVANPDDDHLGDQTLLWDGDDIPVDVDFILMRFGDMIGDGPGQIPPGSTIVSAELKYSVTNGGDPADLHELLVPFVSGSWNDQPWIDTTDPALVPGVHFVEEPVTVAVGPVDSSPGIDVTSSIQKWVNGEIENRGWVFHPTGSDGVEFINPTGEQEHRPRLVVQTPLGEFTFEDGVNGYQGTVDIWTEIDIPLRDVGRDTRVLIDGGVGDPAWAYTKFENIIGTDSGQIPPGTEILDARIEVSIHNGGNVVTVHDMLPGYDFNEYSRAEAFTLDVLPTNVATQGNPRTQPGTGQYTLVPEPDWINDATMAERMIGAYYSPNRFEDIWEPPEASVPEVILPSNPFDPANPPVFFDITVLDSIPEGFTGNTSINVTPSIQKYSNGEPNLGWFLFHEGAFEGPGDGVEWRSSEWSLPDGPKLVMRTPVGNFTFQDGLGGYDGTVDTYIDSGDPDTAFGDLSYIQTVGDDNGERTILIKFTDIIGNGPSQIPPGTKIESAQLSFVTTEQGGASRIWDIMPGYTFDDDTTFTSFGGDPIEGHLFGVLGPEPLQLLPDIGAGAVVLMDVASSVQRYSDGEENTGWAIVPLVPYVDPGVQSGGLGNAGDNLVYTSSEGIETLVAAGPPRLTVVVAGEPPVTAVENFMLH